jgi:tetratricopeptide (TPR) repeat protein
LAVLAAVAAWATWVLTRPEPEELRRSALLAAREGRWADAEADLALIDSPNPSDWLLRAMTALSAGDPEAAIRFARRVDPSDPRAAPAAVVVAQAQRKRHHARAMEAALEDALARDPGLVGARQLGIYLYGIQGRKAELLEQFEALAEHGPLSFDLLHHWCRSHDQASDPEEVQADLEAFVAADPDDRMSRLALADVLRRNREFERAEATLGPLGRDDLDALVVRTRIALDRGDLPGVEALLADAPRDNAALLQIRGRLAMLRRDWPAAVAALRAADAAEPDQVETLLGLAQVLRLGGDPEAAEPVQARAAALQALQALVFKTAEGEPSRETLFELSRACEEAGFDAEARAWLRLALTLDPLDPHVQEALAALDGRLETAPDPGPPR